MAVQVVTTKFAVDSSDWAEFDKALADSAKQAGITEDEVKKLTDQIGKQSREIRDVRGELKKQTIQARELAAAMDAATDPSDQKRLQGQLTKTLTRIKALNTELGKMDSSAPGKINKTSNAFSGLAGIVGGGLLAGGIAGIGAAILQGGKAAVQSAANYEQTRVAFETFLGSAEAAEAALQRLSNFSLATPFTPEQVVQAGQALLAFGEPVETLETSLGRIGDIASGTGKDFNELAVIYGKARVAGTLFAEDINQLTEAGIPIIDEFASILGVTNDQVKSLASDGKISFDTLQTAFTNLTSEGGRFFNLTQAQSETLNGRISTLVGKFQELGKSVGQEAAPAVEAVVEFLIELLDRINELGPAIDSVSEPVNELVTEFERLAFNLGLAETEIDAVGLVFDALRLIIEAGTFQFRQLVEAVSLIVQGFNTAITTGKALFAVFEVISEGVRQVIADFGSFSVDGFIEQIQRAFSSTFEAEESRQNLAAAIDGIKEEIETADVGDPLLFRARINQVINGALEAGLIDEAQKEEYAEALANRLNDIADSASKRPAPKVDIPIAPVLPQNLTEETAKQAKETAQEVAATNEELLDQGLEAALRVQREREAAARAEVAFLQDIFGLRIDAANNAFQNGFSQAVSDQLNAIEQANQLAETGVITQQEFQQRLQDAETNFAQTRLSLQLEYLQAVKDVNTQALQAVQDGISSLEAAQASGSITGGQLSELQALYSERERLRQEDLAAEQAVSDARLSLAQQEAGERTRIAEEEAANRQQIEQAAVGAIQSVLSGLSSFYQTQKERELQAAGENAQAREAIERRYANRENLIKIGQAISSQALAVVKAWATNPILGALLSLAVVGSTAPYIAAMKAQKFATGTRAVPLDGNPHGTDTVPAWLTAGERVVPVSTNRRYFSDFNAIEDGHFKPGEIAALAQMKPFERTMFAAQPFIPLSHQSYSRSRKNAPVRLSDYDMKRLAKLIAAEQDKRDNRREFRKR